MLKIELLLLVQRLLESKKFNFFMHDMMAVVGVNEKNFGIVVKGRENKLFRKKR